MKISFTNIPKHRITSSVKNIQTNSTSFKGNSTLNTQVLLSDVKMEPYREYLIDENTVFESCGYKIDLSSEALKDKITNLRKGKSLIIGKEATQTPYMPNTISRRHLRISRNKHGELTACDLNSLNGTNIKANVKVLDTTLGIQKLKEGQYYLVPNNAVISAFNEKIYLSQYRNRIESLRESEKLIVGRSKNADIVINNTYVSNNHLELRKLGDKVLVKDLHSTNGSSFEFCEQAQYPFPNQFYIKPEPIPNDYRNIRTTMELRKNLPTKIPRDCQISLGKHFCIDLRNKNILGLLEEKGRIEIGRSQSNDIIIDGFYDDASRKHLILEKKGNDIIATDTSSTKTNIIPKNKIKAFNNGVEELRFSQSNIGDCYLLSTLYALSITPKGQEYIERMVSVDEDGNYIVDFYDSPFSISVAPEDLDGQKIGNSEKRSVRGDLGLRAIERAYGRMIRPAREENMTLFAEIDDGGWPEKTLRKITGLSSDVYNLAKRNIFPTLYNICRDGFYNHVITCSTPNKSRYDGYVDPQRRFNKNHAYGIRSINDRNQTIEIVNPHNTRNSTIIGWDEFSQYFDYLNVAKLPNS